MSDNDGGSGGDSNGRGGGGGGGGGDGGEGGQDGAPTTFVIPLSPLEIKARNHAILCTVGFLILLPLGVLLARYARTFTRRWFWGHAVMQLVIAGPVIFVGWKLGHDLANQLEGFATLYDPHQRIGIALLALYVTQLLLGTIIHFVKMQGLFRGHRPPQNYFHVALGLAILALAAYQVHYGLTIEWTFATEGVHAVPDSALHAWMALIIVFWVLYFLGMALLPRQFSREKEGREQMRMARKGEAVNA
ncbi:Cytochrome b561 domain-containing protein [Mycena venus]|uniref:Cytochrome b561 domain-containing protein n=1 Tax=Mycena venus TaxID=2733690 RepID=A0A8H6YFC5_9AGAR|nr:Cytochrome b561 domain-containing protein [Mycena venus]